MIRPRIEANSLTIVQRAIQQCKLCIIVLLAVGTGLPTNGFAHGASYAGVPVVFDIGTSQQQNEPEVTIFFMGTTSNSMLQVPTEYSTIQSAIEAAETGSTIEVAPGIYAENLIIRKPVVLRGNGTILNPDHRSPGILIEDAGSVSIQGFALYPTLDRREMEKAGILISGNTALNIRYVQLSKWVVSIHAHSGASVTADQLKIDSNRLVGDDTTLAGIRVVDGQLLMTNSTISIYSESDFVKGVFATNSHVTLLKNTFIVGRAHGDGSAVYLRNSQGEVHGNEIVSRGNEAVVVLGSRGMSIVGNVVASNTTGIFAGKLDPEDPDELVEVQDNRIVGSASNKVAGIVVEDLPVHIKNNTISGYATGITLSKRSEVELIENLVVGNLGDGIVIFKSANKALFTSNQILGNVGCGVKVMDYGEPLLAAIEGSDNWIAGNAKGDLCVGEFPLPEKFQRSSS